MNAREGGDSPHATNEPEALVAPAAGKFMRWLSEPLSGVGCVIGWVAATLLFLGIVTQLGGPVVGDASQTFYSTWSVEHGRLACMYAPLVQVPTSPLFTAFVLAAPLYSLLTGAAAALLRIGHGVAFPASASLGAHCSSAYLAYYHWAVASHALMATLRLSYLVWPFLLASVVALLRSVGRGHSRLEFASAILLALLMPVYMCIVGSFHPQDVLAMAFLILAAAAVRAHRWVAAGVAVGLAIATQQYSLLVLALLLAMVIRTPARWRFIIGAASTLMVVMVPLLIASNGRALDALVFGSSRITFLSGQTVHSSGGTVLWELHLHGLALFALSRALPIVLAGGLGWWATGVLGADVFAAAPLLSLTAVSLALRLVFEQNLFGYYFMALSVALVVLDLGRGRLRGSVVAWLVVVSLTFNPLPETVYLRYLTYGINLYLLMPLLAVIAALASVMYDAFRHRVRWYLVATIAIITATDFPTLYGYGYGIHPFPQWIWQVLFVPTALALALEPLAAAITGQPGLRHLLPHSRPLVRSRTR